MGKLVLFQPDGSAREIKLDRERITIGRRPDNDVCLPEPPVSGAHAAVLTILADSFLEDLGSTNGTLVNGKSVTKHFLRDRDEIDIGRQILVYLADDSATLETPPESVVQMLGAAAAGQEAGRPAVAVPNGTAHGKRRSDGASEGPPPAADAIQRFVAAEIERATPSGPDAAAAETATGEAPAGGAPAPEFSAPETVPSLRVLTGAHAGRTVALARAETLVGRAGVQVATVQRTDGAIRLVQIEGGIPVNVNGVPLPADGRELEAGDIVEIAGSMLELVPPVGPGA